MDERLTTLKTDFTKIMDIKQENMNMLSVFHTRIQQIKKIYTEFIETNRSHLFIFTLDSFYFQSKLIDIEYEDILRVFNAINNRMYCDYYKLFKIIKEYVYDTVQDAKLIEIIKVNDNFPVYKDLEPFKQYDFVHVQNLHETILVVLTYLNSHVSNKEHDLKTYENKQKIGLNIDSFVNTFNFNNIVMKEKNHLFMTYIEFFHTLHTKYFKRFTMKLQLFFSQINNDIKLDSVDQTRNKKKEMLNDLTENNIDETLLKELKHTISFDSSSTGSRDRTFTGSPLVPQTPHNSITDEWLSELSTTDEPSPPKYTFVKHQLIKEEAVEGEEEAVAEHEYTFTV